jgi:hypothetical protein
MAPADYDDVRRGVAQMLKRCDAIDLHALRVQGGAPRHAGRMSSA